MPSKKLLAIDPGNKESGFAIIDMDDYFPLAKGKWENEKLRSMIAQQWKHQVDHVVIEMVASYGMAVGETVFETVYWIGRFYEAVGTGGATRDRMKRIEVKKNICHNTTAKDANITQALVDRFAPGTRNHGKGTKKEPGWFYGFKADVWQAYALGVTYIDKTLWDEKLMDKENGAEE